MYSQLAVLKVLENFQKNVFDGALFEQFELSNVPLITVLETDNITRVVGRRLWWNHFLVK